LAIFGEKKFWMLISDNDRSKFIELCRSTFKKKFRKNCGHPLSHFNYFLAPRILKEAKIDFKIICQKPGELLIIGPGVIHQGISLGQSMGLAFSFDDPNFVFHINKGYYMLVFIW
jgi:hypothetical protein